MWQFTKCIHLTEVYHFHDMIDMLVGCGYNKGTTLFGYGYDFRQSNRYTIVKFNEFVISFYRQMLVSCQQGIQFESHLSTN